MSATRICLCLPPLPPSLCPEGGGWLESFGKLGGWCNAWLAGGEAGSEGAAGTKPVWLESSNPALCQPTHTAVQHTPCVLSTLSCPSPKRAQLQNQHSSRALSHFSGEKFLSRRKNFLTLFFLTLDVASAFVLVSQLVMFLKTTFVQSFIHAKSDAWGYLVQIVVGTCNIISHVTWADDKSSFLMCSNK